MGSILLFLLGLALAAAAFGGAFAAARRAIQRHEVAACTWPPLVRERASRGAFWVFWFAVAGATLALCSRGPWWAGAATGCALVAACVLVERVRSRREFGHARIMFGYEGP